MAVSLILTDRFLFSIRFLAKARQKPADKTGFLLICREPIEQGVHRLSQVQEKTEPAPGLRQSQRFGQFRQGSGFVTLALGQQRLVCQNSDQNGIVESFSRILFEERQFFLRALQTLRCAFGYQNPHQGKPRHIEAMKDWLERTGIKLRRPGRGLGDPPVTLCQFRLESAGRLDV